MIVRDHHFAVREAGLFVVRFVESKSVPIGGQRTLVIPLKCL